MSRKRQALRCAGTNRLGASCGNFAVLGAVVCRFHGGGAPQVRRAARRALDTDLAGRLLASMTDEWQSDGRLGPRQPSGYGCLPPNKRERERDAELVAAWRSETDPFRLDLRAFLITTRQQSAVGHFRDTPPAGHTGM